MTASVAESSRTQFKDSPAVVVVAIDPANGKTGAGRSFKGYCAELEADNAQDVGDKAIQLTKPVKPPTGEVIPIYKQCLMRFDRSQVPRRYPF